MRGSSTIFFNQFVSVIIADDALTFWMVVAIATPLEVTTHKIGQMGGLLYCLQSMTFFIL